MITISEIVEEEVTKVPFLQEALFEGLINLSALARNLKPTVEEKLQKSINETAVNMSLKRYCEKNYSKLSSKTVDFHNYLSDITVRSNLCTYTFANSKSLTHHQTQLLHEMEDKQDMFCTFSQGVYERTIIISDDAKELAQKIFKDERLLSEEENLTSLTIKLGQENTTVSGIYYWFFKKIAWEDISVIEVISTTHEFTVVVNDEDVDQVFSIFMKVKKGL